MSYFAKKIAEKKILQINQKNISHIAKAISHVCPFSGHFVHFKPKKLDFIIHFYYTPQYIKKRNAIIQKISNGFE